MLAGLKEFFAGTQTPAFIVGGCLRDSLLSLPPGRDVDIAVAGDAQILAKDLTRSFGGTLVPLSPERGMLRVVIPHSGASSHKESHFPQNLNKNWTIDLFGFSGSIEEDLARRDFTVDALALPISDWDEETPDLLPERVIDPFHGKADLARKCIRAVGPSVFRDDPIRLLRSVRLAALLGFRLDPETVGVQPAPSAGVARRSEGSPEQAYDCCSNR